MDNPSAPPPFTLAELRLLQGCVLRQLAGDRQMIAIGLPGTGADAARRDALRALADKLTAVLEEAQVPTPSEVIERLGAQVEELARDRDEAREAFLAANREAGMWQGAAKLSLERADCAERQRDEAREAARECVLVYRSVEDPDEFETWLQGTAWGQWPWLKETPDAKEEARDE